MYLFFLNINSYLTFRIAQFNYSGEICEEDQFLPQKLEGFLILFSNNNQRSLQTLRFKLNTF